MRVREARDDERPDAMNVLDAAMLETGRVGDATLFVAVEEGRVLGALALLDGTVEAVAVRRRRRGGGVGTALVEAANEHEPRLRAEFDGDVRPFYERLGFDVRPVGPDRYRGVRERG
jgi:GNAT superfamily N-acetyltransferase